MSRKSGPAGCKGEGGKPPDPKQWSRDQEPDPIEIRRLKTEIQRLNKRLLISQSGEELIVRAVQDALSKGADLALPPLRPKGRKKEAVVPVLHATDLQFGKLTEDYNSSVAADRLMALADKTLQWAEIYRHSFSVNKLVLFQGGDMVEGEIVFSTQAHQIDQSVFDQAMRGAPEALSRMILRLLDGFREIEVYAICGNHGRVSGGRRTSRDHPRSSWDRVCYETQRLLLKQAGKRVKWTIAEEEYVVARVFDWGLMLIHGDKGIRGHAGHPWYGAARKTQGMIDVANEPWDYLFYGHFHNHASAEVNRRLWYATGSPESSNTFARAELNSMNWPSQRLCVVHPDHGIIGDHQIFLCSKRERIPQKRRAEKWLA